MTWDTVGPDEFAEAIWSLRQNVKVCDKPGLGVFRLLRRQDPENVPGGMGPGGTGGS
jgi:hypothetical protein